MTIKEQLEILRGEPIHTWTGDPLKIPCIETSDPEKLCRHPVVSVNMITYNHEPYIRQAIEGVMMQKADFEFELVIGEDCSSDKTREICFEYQRRYPDKIRVLWAEQNVYKLGGNSRRCLAHSRGEFIAFCEGDDYWIDPLKLQKQVAVMRPGVVMCVAGCEWHLPNNQIYIDSRWKVLRELKIEEVADRYFHTSTLLIRKETLRTVFKRYSELPYWYDSAKEACVAAEGKTRCLPDVVSVYRWTGRGDSGAANTKWRQILLLTQTVELFLWGPKRVRPFFGGLTIINCAKILLLRKKRNLFSVSEVRAAKDLMRLCWFSLSLKGKFLMFIRCFRKIVAKTLLPRSLAKKYVEGL